MLINLEKYDCYLSYQDYQNLFIENLNTSSFLMVKQHNEQFIQKKLLEYCDYFDQLYKNIDNNIKLDLEQRIAILNNEDYAMIIAGAGSGKTTTIAGKVKYLVDKLNIDPNRILIVSYTNKAVDELKERINNQFNIPASIFTFHKLAYSYLKDQSFHLITNTQIIINIFINKILLEDKKTAQQLLLFYHSYFNLSSLMLKLLHNPYYNKIMSYYFSNKTLRGDYLYHQYEVIVANILYLNNIYYIYHKKGFSTYFILDVNNQKYYLKIFKNKESICKPPFILSNHKHMISILIPEDNIELLISELQKYSIIKTSFSFYDYSQKMLKLDPSQYERFSLFCHQFIKMIKVNNIDINTITSTNKREQLFLSFITKLYNYYQAYLKDNNYLDFDELITEAKKSISTKEINYQYIIVDEYQDISSTRFLFIKELVNYYHSKLVVVGDDWQTIFSFAGSQINLFLDFKQQMGYAEELKITNTYRNSQQLINIAGSFIMNNHKQIKKELHSLKRITNPLTIYLYQNNYLNILIKTINYLIKKYGSNKNILLLGRYQFDISFIKKSKYFQIDNDTIIYKENKLVVIKFMTIHKAKGLGYDNVILLNASSDIYGFPSTIENDPLLKLINNHHSLDEERRLFYVALTRTKNEIIIFAPRRKMSPFVKEIAIYSKIKL